MNRISGVITALSTPFKNGLVDEASFRKLVQHQLSQGIDGFVVNGTTGESPTLQWPEVKRLYDIVREEAGTRVPVIVGTGLNSTAKTIELSKEANAWRPDAVLVVVPYYNRPPQRGLIAHFKAVADSSKAPVILYNVPTRTVASLDVESVIELAKHPNIKGLKDATGNMEILEDMKGGVPADFSLLSGDDATSVDYCARGGHGVISVSSHVIGREMKDYIARVKSSPEGVLAEYAEKYAAFMKLLYCEANPIPLKAALHWMGLFDSMEARLPLVALDNKFHQDFKACLAALKKI